MILSRLKINTELTKCVYLLTSLAGCLHSCSSEVISKYEMYFQSLQLIKDIKLTQLETSSLMVLIPPFNSCQRFILLLWSHRLCCFFQLFDVSVCGCCLKHCWLVNIKHGILVLCNTCRHFHFHYLFSCLYSQSLNLH